MSLKRKRQDILPPLSTGKKPGRASVACLQCRRLKTRCHPGLGPCCLRCETLRLECSFQNGQTKGSVTDRLNWLEEKVEQLLQDRSAPSRDAPSRDETSTDVEIPPYIAPICRLQDELNLSFESPELQLQLAISPQEAAPLLEWQVNYNLLLLSFLLCSFYQKYSRWATTPQVSFRALALRLEKESPLFLAVASLLGNRHAEKSLPLETESKLVAQMAEMLGQASISTQHTIETLQGMLLISLYAATLSKFGHQFDSWHLTGTTMQLYILLRLDNIPEFGDELSSRRLWNHLCLTHMSYSIDWNRPCMIDDDRLNKCVRTMDLFDAENHDGRMVAEISLYAAIYRILNASMNGDQAEEEMEIWKNDWGYLFEQEQSQYLEIGYYYGLLLAWDRVDHHIATGYATQIVDRALVIPADNIISVSNHILYVIVYAGLFINNKAKLENLQEFLQTPSVGMQQDRRWDVMLRQITQKVSSSHQITQRGSSELARLH